MTSWNCVFANSQLEFGQSKVKVMRGIYLENLLVQRKMVFEKKN
jgi:hypothetical protein